MLDHESETILNQDLGPIALSEEQQQVLLRTARKAIEQAVTESGTMIDEVFDDQLQQPSAVFVTLWQRKQDEPESEGSNHLRGCIGRLQADFPLYLAVKNAAISAATRDPRFSPVRPDEVDDLTIEIAILTPLETVDKLEEIVIGRDGLVIEAMSRRGLLLPKVASRMQWDRSEFLRNVCLKAGLPDNTWPENGQLYRFKTTVFHE